MRCGTTASVLRQAYREGWQRPARDPEQDILAPSGENLHDIFLDLPELNAVETEVTAVGSPRAESHVRRHPSCCRSLPDCCWCRVRLHIGTSPWLRPPPVVLQSSRFSFAHVVFLFSVAFFGCRHGRECGGRGV